MSAENGHSISEVTIPQKAVADFAGIIGESKTGQLTATGAQVRHLLNGRRFWHVNSTATGGGVAEMLLPLLGYANNLGVDSKWVVIHGNGAFFQVTKRIHNALHGSPGDGGPLGRAETEVYRDALSGPAMELKGLLKPGEPVVLHDPQTAGLAPGVRASGGTVIWRCHVGTEAWNEHNEAAWEFLKPFLESSVDQFVFTRESYAPEWIDRSKLTVIPPSIDPLSAKNTRRDEDEMASLLLGSGVVVNGKNPRNPMFRRADGSGSPVMAQVDLNGTPAVPDDAALVTQVSRWDRLKDMGGVLKAFAESRMAGNAHLALVGPDMGGVSDDPEGAGVLADCIEQLERMPESVKRRVTLASVPMDDPEENAAIINAIQRHSTVVTQKSLAEGFGLTVTEAMYKRRAIIASRVGGIPDQVNDGVEGLLLDDPSDLESFGALLDSLLTNGARRDSLGAVAEQRAISEFLMDRHLMQYLDLLKDCAA